MKKASGLGRSDGGCRGMADVRQGRKRVGAQVLGEGRWGFRGGKLRAMPGEESSWAETEAGAVFWAPFGWPVL